MGEGNPVIFLHGWGLDYKAFLPIKEYLIGYKCYFFSMLDVDQVATLQDYADEIKKVILQDNLNNITIVGHSFGGRVAILLAIQLSCVKGLVLVDAAGLKPRFSIKKTLKVLSYKLRKKLKLNTEKCGSKDYVVLSNNMRKTFKNIVNFHLDNYLKDIRQDTLVIFGDKDKETPLYMAKRFKNKIPKCALILLKGDHFAYLKNFNQFSLIIREYLNGIYEQ
ncbi:MAG: alpha/beta hydrolase [Christensenella sp.]|nr:alpha/beta hydrolase [Christensenella sp.]